MEATLSLQKLDELSSKLMALGYHLGVLEELLEEAEGEEALKLSMLLAGAHAQLSEADFIAHHMLKRAVG